MEGPIAQTTYGRVQGSVFDGVNEFLGIPYGASTAPPRRFLPPQPPVKWAGVRETCSYGDRAPQVATPSGALPEVELLTEPNPAAAYGPMSEDCLNLNVWTPAIDDGGRPVLFYVHGGGFSLNSAAMTWARGARLARRGNVIVVSANHRLGVLGFLAAQEILGEKYVSAGIAGMLDLVAALQWVQENITAFGGDPARVLIFGESGGGAKVSTLLAMPEAVGLFQRAAVQSGPGLRGLEPSEARLVVERFVAAAGLAGSSEELLTMPTEAVIEAQARLMLSEPNQRAMRYFRPLVGTPHLPAHPFEPVAASSAAKVPLIIGTNRDEMSWALTGNLEYGKMTFDRAAELLEESTGPAAQAIVAHYRSAHPDLSPTALFVRVNADLRFRAPSMLLANRKREGGAASVYTYLLTFEPQVHDGTLGSPHILDVPLIFNNTDLPYVGLRPEREMVSSAMSDAWIAFAASGDPNHSGIPQWLPYSASQHETMVFDVSSRLVLDPDGADLIFLAASVRS